MPAQPAAASVSGWVELTLRVPLDDADLLAEALADVADGVAIEPVGRSDEHIDFAYEIVDEPALVRASFRAPFPPSARRMLRGRLALLPLSAPLPRLRFRAVPDGEWEEAWKRGFEVLHAGERLVVRPSWEVYAPAEGEVVITLDPGRAFGTGQHATTRLCLAALESEAGAGRSALDVGAGSGILAIAASLLGCAPVRGIDIDPETVAVAEENAAANGVAIEFAAGTLGPGEGAWPWPEPSSADLVLANLTPAVLATLAPALAAAARPGGALVASGFSERTEAEVRAALEAAGLRIESTTAEGEWRCVLARRDVAA